MSEDIKSADVPLVHAVSHKNKNKLKEKKKLSVTFFIGLFLCIILLPILIMNMVIIIKGALYPDNVPTIFGIVPMVVLSDSMKTERESISAGDMIFASSADTLQLQENDVILFRDINSKDGKSLVVHRIVSIEEVDGVRRFTTKGDNNNTEDIGFVTESYVVGKYSFNIPKLGNFVLFLKEPLGITVCIGIPLVAMLVYEIVKKSIEMRKKEREFDELKKITEEERLKNI